MLPTKHTFRVSMTVFLASKNVDRDRICDSLGWQYQTEMIRRYLANHLSIAEDSPAVLITEAIASSHDIPIFES